MYFFRLTFLINIKNFNRFSFRFKINLIFFRLFKFKFEKFAINIPFFLSYIFGVLFWTLIIINVIGTWYFYCLFFRINRNARITLKWAWRIRTRFRTWRFANTLWRHNISNLIHFRCRCTYIQIFMVFQLYLINFISFKVFKYIFWFLIMKWLFTLTTKNNL